MGILLKIPERHCRTVFFRLFRLADNSPLSCIKIYPLKNAILEAKNSLLSDHDTCSKQVHKSSVIDFNIQLVSVASSITISFGRAFIFFIPIGLATPPARKNSHSSFLFYYNLSRFFYNIF